jgi:hypothetical protein
MPVMNVIVMETRQVREGLVPQGARSKYLPNRWLRGDVCCHHRDADGAGGESVAGKGASAAGVPVTASTSTTPAASTVTVSEGAGRRHDRAERNGHGEGSALRVQRHDRPFRLRRYYCLFVGRSPPPASPYCDRRQQVMPRTMLAATAAPQRQGGQRCFRIDERAAPLK